MRSGLLKLPIKFNGRSYFCYYMKKAKKRKDNYYQQRKSDPEFKAHRNALARAYRESHPEIKDYQKAYGKKYYQAHKEELNAKRKLYPDLTRNERVNRFKKREREALGRNYIIALLTRSGKVKKEDITPYMIAKRRKQIVAKREAKGKI